MLHEFMHRWANFIVPPHWNTHWDFTSANGILGGFDIRDLKNGGDGQYRAPGAYTGGQSYNIKPYSPIELYLAGFIPPEEVPGLWVGLNGELVNYEWRGSVLWSLFTASRGKTYKIDDIIAEHGPRVPNHVHSQKDFRAAVILLVNEDYPVFSATLELLSDDASLFSYASEDQFDDWYNFYEATGGRGTMAMDGLSQFKRDPGAAKRPALPSFGTLPPPIICHWP